MPTYLAIALIFTSMDCKKWDENPPYDEVYIGQYDPEQDQDGYYVAYSSFDNADPKMFNESTHLLPTVLVNYIDPQSCKPSEE